MQKPKIAVIQFPGSNCEYETLRAVSDYGAEAGLLRWNVPEKEFHRFGGYILPGGFSYQDRIRAGVIASRLPITGFLHQANQEGKPILGICNGCQILAETGLVPNRKADLKIEVALAPNEKQKNRLGFICDWTYVKIEKPNKSLFFSEFENGEVLPIPINHGEGRFVVSAEMAQEWPDLTALRFCDQTGLENEANTPNGSTYFLAGIANVDGNVLALMPHPERAAWIRQMPSWLTDQWAKKKKQDFSAQTDSVGPWARLFQSMVKAAAKV